MVKAVRGRGQLVFGRTAVAGSRKGDPARRLTPPLRRDTPIACPAFADFRTHRENIAMTQPRTGAVSLDRRRFLQVGAAAALGLAAGGRLAFAADKHDPFGGFLLGVQSYTFRHFDLEQDPQTSQGPQPALRRVLPEARPGQRDAGTARRRPEAVQGVRGHAAGLGRPDLHQGHGQEPHSISSWAKRSA